MKLRLLDVGPECGILLGVTIEVFLIMLGLGLANPILPPFAHSFGVGATAVGLLVTVFGLAHIFVNIPAGQWTARFGRRRLMVVGPLVTSVGSFGFVLAGSFGQLLFCVCFRVSARPDSLRLPWSCSLTSARHPIAGGS